MRAAEVGLAFRLPLARIDLGSAGAHSNILLLCGPPLTAASLRLPSRLPAISENEETRPAEPDGFRFESTKRSVKTDHLAYFLNFSLASFEKRKTSFWLLDLAETLISLPKLMIVRAGLAGI